MMLWQRRTANTIRTLLQQLKYNDVHVDLEDESGPAAEISEAKSTWEENCHGKVVCVFMLAGVEAQGQTQQQGMACCGDLILGCHVHFNLPQAVKPADSATGEAHHHCCMVGTLKMKLSDICRSYQEDPAKTKAAEKDHWVSMRCVAVCARFFFLIGQYGFAGAVH